MIDPRLLRENPDLIRAAQAKRGLSSASVDQALEADVARRTAILDFEHLRAEQKSLGKLIPKAQGEEKADLLSRTKTLAADVKTAEAAQNAAEQDWRDAVYAIPNPAADESPAGGEDDFVVLSEHGTPRDFAAEGFEPRDHVELGRILGAIDIERGAKVSGSRFYYLTGIGADLELALVMMAMDQARSAGFTTMIPPALVKPRAMEGTGFLGQAADDVYRIEGQDTYLVGTSEVPLAAYHSDEILDIETLPRRYAAFSPCFRKEAGSHGKDTRGIFRVHWFDKVEMFSYTTLDEAAAEHERLLGWEKEWLDKLELRLPRHRRRRRRPRALGTAQVRLRGLDPDPGQVPRADLDLQLHRLPGPAARHPGSLPGRHRPGRHAQRHPVRDHPDHRRAARDPPAGRRLGARPAGAAALPAGPRGPAAGRRRRLSLSKPPVPQDWRPRVLALDIDGTLLKWVEGTGQHYEQIAPVLYDAVQAAVDGGAHVVLASGRSPHGMTKIADLLDLPREGADRLWVVSSNGAVISRYPPLEVVHERTFDASEAVRQVLEQHPEALVAVEERGVGYRVNRPFPDGELSGEMIETELEEIVGGPVSRVIIRDPTASADDFVAMAAKLGLHGTDYVVGWTAWLDLAPVGVSKASGLEYVVEQLGLTSADVLAIGDGRNDIEMLGWAARGVAMGQAVQEVLDAADFTTDTVYDDGAAVELRRWFRDGP